jgi:hypothetical protein
MNTSEFAWEAFKGLGSLAGFWSTGYVLWDRFVRHVPQAFLVPRPLTEGSVNIVVRLFVKNVAPRPILIGWENPENHLRIALDDCGASSIHSFLSEPPSSLTPARRANFRCSSPRDMVSFQRTHRCP